MGIAMTKIRINLDLDVGKDLRECVVAHLFNVFKKSFAEDYTDSRLSYAERHQLKLELLTLFESVQLAITPIDSHDRHNQDNYEYGMGSRIDTCFDSPIERLAYQANRIETIPLYKKLIGKLKDYLGTDGFVLRVGFDNNDIFRFIDTNIKNQDNIKRIFNNIPDLEMLFEREPMWHTSYIDKTFYVE